MCAVIVRGDARRLPLADGSVSAIVTSPPYFALRSYRDDGEHFDGQIGSEETPAAFVEALLVCAEEWRRVLRPDGCVWVNLGDKYAGSGVRDNKGFNERWGNSPGQRKQEASGSSAIPFSPGIRPKSLMGLPWRFAIAMIDNGWILRQEVVWSKPNGLPESVSDRPRRSHEQWFMFTKEPRYFSALDELREPQAEPWRSTGALEQRGTKNAKSGDSGVNKALQGLTPREYNPLGRLPGSVRTVPTEPLAPGPIYDCDERYGAGKRIGGYDAPWPMPDHRIMHAKDLWPWLQHLVRQGLSSYVVGPHVDHFAAFPQAWPEWIISGWVPLRGICVVCNEGLRPVVEKAAGGKRRRDHGMGARHTEDAAAFDVGNRTAAGRSEWAEGVTATITGYACPCGPEGTTPTRKPLVADVFGGTGTVAGVARKLGANAISIDLSHDYSRLAQYLLTTGRFGKSERRAWERRQGSLL